MSWKSERKKKGERERDRGREGEKKGSLRQNDVVKDL